MREHTQKASEMCDAKCIYEDTVARVRSIVITEHTLDRLDIRG